MSEQGKPGGRGVNTEVLIAACTDALLAVTADGEILTWNAGAERLFGFEPAEAIGQPLPKLLGPADRALELRRWHMATASGNATYESVLHRKDGKALPAEISVNAVRDARRGVEFFAVSIKEIPEVNRLKSEFLANMGHELRTPLRAIVGLAELLHVGKAGAMDPDQHQCVGEILSSARHLSRLINDILDLAKIESGRLEFHLEPVDLYRLINEVLDIVRSQVARRRILVKLKCDPAVTAIVADAGKLKQVVYTFVSNALKFCRDDGQLSIRVLPDIPDYLRLEVEDDGPGIGPEEMPRLFSEFHYLNGHATRKQARSAFGLALSKRIVEAHGGQVGFTSEPGAGSVFFAVLPLRAANARAAEPDGPQTGSGPRVLVIDDEVEDRTLIAGALRAAGFSVETAVNGAAAIEACLARSYAAITLDLLLPDMNGWDVLRAIRGGGPNVSTPVIVVSVVADHGDAAAFAISDYIVKPAGVEDLIEVLQRHGIRTPPARTVLVLDEDHGALEPMRAVLEQQGYRTLHASTPAQAAAAVERDAPDVVVFDALMDSMNGLDFVAQLRRTPRGRRIPAIVWSQRKLLPEDLQRLERATLSVVTKGHGVAEAVLAELRAALETRGEDGA